MLVSPARDLPEGPEWAYEVKWDGVRALVSVAGAVRVRSRHGRDPHRRLPGAADLRRVGLPAVVVLDGELVCLDPDSGRPSFDRLMGGLGSRLPSLAARQTPG